jgi:hypothetical protein
MAEIGVVVEVRGLRDFEWYEGPPAEEPGHKRDVAGFDELGFSELRATHGFPNRSFTFR